MKYEDLDDQLDLICDAIISIKDRKTCKNFLKDICTINELYSLVQRLQVAYMLNNNKTYQEIADETHASTATISRVNRCLNYGEKGYKAVLNNLPDDVGKKN